MTNETRLSGSEINAKNTTNGTLGDQTRPCGTRIYLEVPFEQQENAKAAGLRWDNILRKWYAPIGELAMAFGPSIQQATQPPGTSQRVYFKVPFVQKDRAKAMGLRWDCTIRKWYAANSEIAQAFSRSIGNGKKLV